MNKSILKNTNPSINWYHEVLSALTNDRTDFVLEIEDDYVFIKNDGLIINLLDLGNNFLPADLIKLQEHYSVKNIKLIHLWEDVWFNRKDQVLARLKSIFGYNTKIHGRQTKIEKLSKPIAETFLNVNHLQGYVSSRYKLGLFFKGELVAVATFSALRKMNHSENYKSVELIRFAVKAGYSVIGGLSKLISSFRDLQKPNDIMTYADRDWSAGEAYIKLGFEFTDGLAPQTFNLDENFNRKLRKETDEKNDPVIYNTGSLKYLLRF